MLLMSHFFPVSSIEAGSEHQCLSNKSDVMDALVELVSVCRAADTDKITERKVYKCLQSLIYFVI